MSQELLFLIFITLELFALVALYNFVIIPMNAKATITRWENKMLAGDFDTVAMLDQYTEHLMVNLVEIIKKIVPEIMGGYMSAGTRQLKADPENAMAVATAEFLDELPLPARLVANKLLPRINDAMNNATDKPAEATATYNPGLDKP